MSSWGSERYYWKERSIVVLIGEGREALFLKPNQRTDLMAARQSIGPVNILSINLQWDTLAR